MKLFYYRGGRPNFGDELNPWLLPRVFPGLFDENESEVMLGIGSILYDFHPPGPRKIVFGAGFGGYTRPPKLDASWNVYCVRGPLTAKALFLPAELVAGDAALLIREHYTPHPVKRFDVSFMPHFHSLDRGQWEKVCKLADIRIIDPRLPVDDVLQMIAESKMLISEAMHGAIVADALRVPWIAMRPHDQAHHMKWHDWAGALNFQVRFQGVSASTLKEWRLARRTLGRFANRFFGLLPRGVGEAVDSHFTEHAAESLLRVAKEEPQLSKDSALQLGVERLCVAASSIASDYSRRANHHCSP